MEISVIIPAGGTSSRYKGGNKLLEIINGKPVIMQTIAKFIDIEGLKEIIIPASESMMPIIKELTMGMEKIKIVKGGSTRQESVYNGLKAAQKCDFIAIHDAARPLISKETIKKAFEEVKTKKAVIVAVRTIDTIKIVDSNNKIISTPNRDTLWNVQTPQIFDFETIKAAHEELKGRNYTDDGCLLEALGKDVYIVEGEYINFKITTKEDLIKANTILQE